ncbi:alpha-N-acetylgalactosaminide alpha-2,6-sialyltransferase 5-like isoform X2 [Anneissia japonica]|uniref:alpha-N-acetylgalactosaminide alpha-2,6-sialyltransferase 5-like isoform X2 n=1 Tax=Anneissia japonica TaxID=1529436 RepID=UPI001425AF48|nr:alpha-N-acetylgalactosaminide alpha-2,6-sialyltransferase 5-like isoform X2 [Anneissia japonica]
MEYITVGLLDGYFSRPTKHQGMLRICIYSGLVSLVIYIALMWKPILQRRVPVVQYERSADCNTQNNKLVHVFVDENTTEYLPTTDPTPPVIDGYLSVEDKPLRLHCEQCAIVASSGRLLNKGAGFDIDQGVCVIRMNTAPTKGFEEDVGTRTTIRVIGHSNLYNVINKDQKLQNMLFSDERTRTEMVIVSWLFYDDFKKEKDEAFRVTKNYSKVYSNVSFYYTTPAKVKLAENIFMEETGISREAARTWLSTGWMTMLFAIDICDWIDVYGLVPDDYCSNHPNDTAPYHYYDPDSKRECWYYNRSEKTILFGHKFLTEKAIFARWAKKFNIFFHYPSWEAVVTNSSHVETPFLKIYGESKRNGKLRRLELVEKMKKRIAARRAYLKTRQKNIRKD